MDPGRQALLGIFMAVLSSILILGSFTLSIAEIGSPFAVADSEDTTATRTRGPFTYEPGQPTFTPETPTPIPTNGKCPPPEGWSGIIIEAGQTIDDLAAKYGITKEELLKKNCLLVDTLIEGSEFFVPPLPTVTATPTQTPTRTSTKIPTRTRRLNQQAPPNCTVIAPAGWVTYRIRSGDTLSALGRRYNISYSYLAQVNCIFYPYKIVVGQLLWVPYVYYPPYQSPTPRPSFTPAPSSTPVTPLFPTQSRTPILSGTAASTQVSTPSMQPTNPVTNTSAPTVTAVTPSTAVPPDTPIPQNTPAPTIPPAPTNNPVPTTYPGPGSAIREGLLDLLGWINPFTNRSG